MISGGPKDTITSLWTKGLKALVPPNSFGPPTMVAAVFDFKDRGIPIGNPVEISMKYQLKSIGSPVEISMILMDIIRKSS